MSLHKWCSVGTLLLHCGVFFVTVDAAASPAPSGPYAITSATFSDERFDWSNTHIEVVYPVGTANQTFPLVSYAHGYSNTAYDDYHSLFNELASWGYVVVAPRTCQYGCFTPWNCKNLASDPYCFGAYYKMQLLAIDWAKEGSAKLPINFTGGVGVAGHSMGGQATMFSAALGADSHNIRAAVLHHAYTHTFPAIQKVPFLAFTGTNDTTAPPPMAFSIFNATGACAERGLVNKIDAEHSEPMSDKPYYNPQLAWFTVAWLKVHLDRTPVASGVDFEELLYGAGSSSLCHGGDGAMANCTLLRKTPTTATKLIIV